MISVPAGTRILLATRPVDFRKGAHGLAALAQEVLAENPFSGRVIVYRSKRSDRVKILVWDTSGLVLIWSSCSLAFASRRASACERGAGIVPLAANHGRRREALTGRI